MKEVDFRDDYPNYEPVGSFLQHFSSKSEFINDLSSGLFFLINGFYHDPRQYKRCCVQALKELKEFMSSK